MFQILETRVKSEAASELGPLKYLSELTGVEMNRIINWLLLVIIFVFDPLAIALVIAANFAFAQLRSKEGYHMYNASFLHEEEIDNPEYKEWEEATINDGLEDLPWEEETEDEDLTPADDWQIVDEEPQIEVKMSGESSLNMLNEEVKGVPVMVDPKTGKLFYQTEDTSEQPPIEASSEPTEDTKEVKLKNTDKILNDPGVSAWRKKKLQDYLEGKTKRYF